MNAKELFQSDKKLAGWWAGVVGAPEFEQVMLHASVVIFESNPTQEARAGALAFREAIKYLSANDEAQTETPRPQLRYETLNKTDKKTEA